MAKKVNIYTRVARPVPTIGTYSSLWAGPDHLLQVSSNGYTETYQRFDYRDIQTFLICSTSRRTGWAWFWGVLAGIFAVTMIRTLTDADVPFASGFFFVLTLVMFVWNFALGPTCAVYLVTRVQMLRLPSLIRRRKVERALAHLRPLIEQSQAALVATPPPAGADSPPSL